MIYYLSSRNKDVKKYTFSESLLKGIATDGGLLTPEKIPAISIDEIKNLGGKTYQEIALIIFEKFETDFEPLVLKKIINRAYGNNFSDPKIVPVIKLDKNQYLLELWHGPTAAFKDMALQIMPLLFSESLKKLKHKNKYLVLAATSGDTGKAALEGYKDLDNISMLVLYPKEKVSQLQELQMTTQEGLNVNVLALNSDFDGTQTIVKEIFGDEEFNRILKRKFSTILTSANSINWGRLIPQIVYYFSGYTELVKKKEIRMGQKINIAVPTGNFGNILAGFLAKKMGLPIDKLICASNDNDAVSRFLKSGVYDISSRKMKPTFSPAMDILIASNIERLLFLLTGDQVKVSGWMESLKKTNKFSVDNEVLKKIGENIYPVSVSNKSTLKTINNYYLNHQYLFDPHTAVAVKAAEEFMKKKLEVAPVLICSTAHWSKFSSAIYQALGLQGVVSDIDRLEHISGLDNVSAVPISISGLSRKKIRFKKVIDPELSLVKEQIEKFLTNVKT